MGQPLDRLSKWLVESNVSAMDTVRVIPGLFNIVRSENRGMAFGIMNDSTNEWRTTLLLVLSAAAVDEMVARTSTGSGPWTLVAANDKKHARVQVLRTLCDSLEEALDG